MTTSGFSSSKFAVTYVSEQSITVPALEETEQIHFFDWINNLCNAFLCDNLLVLFIKCLSLWH